MDDLVSEQALQAFDKVAAHSPAARCILDNLLAKVFRIEGPERQAEYRRLRRRFGLDASVPQKVVTTAGCE